MQTLELDCPSCGETLELDAGFAGGVCRCSSCGTLMTVPHDTGRAEQLSAPEPQADYRSDASQPAGRSGAERQRPSQRKSKSEKRGKTGRGKKKGKDAKGRAAGNATIEAGEYRTASGKLVQVDEPIRVPMAQAKRKKIRMITTIVFLSVVLGLALIVTLVLVLILRGPGQPGTNNTAGGGSSQNAGPGSAPENIPPPEIGPRYDPTANPYQLDFTNVAGIPVQGKVAIVVEASQGDSAFWMTQASDLIRSGLSKDGEPTQAALFAATNAEPLAFNEGKTTSVSQIDSTQLAAWFTGLTYTREIDRAAGIKRALETDPDVIVLFFSGGNSTEINQWSKLLEGKDTVVHAILIDSVSPRPVQQWIRDRDDSLALALSSGQIKDWQEDAAAPE